MKITVFILIFAPIIQAMAQENFESGTLETVYPRIYVNLSDAGHTDVTLSSDDSPAESKFLSDLVVMYAFDKGDFFQIVSTRNLRELEVTIEELHEASLKNLRALNLDIRAQKGERIMMLTAGGDYEATLILLPEVWESISGMVEGNIVVSVPARDVIYVTGDAEKENLKDLRAYTSKLLENADKPLSRNFFLRSELKWVEYEGFAE